MLQYFALSCFQRVFWILIFDLRLVRSSWSCVIATWKVLLSAFHTAVAKMSPHCSVPPICSHTEGVSHGILRSLCGLPDAVASSHNVTMEEYVLTLELLLSQVWVQIISLKIFNIELHFNLYCISVIWVTSTYSRTRKASFPLLTVTGVNLGTLWMKILKISTF